VIIEQTVERRFGNGKPPERMTRPVTRIELKLWLEKRASNGDTQAANMLAALTKESNPLMSKSDLIESLRREAAAGDPRACVALRAMGISVLDPNSDQGRRLASMKEPKRASGPRREGNKLVFAIVKP
jgi:hypothetical protein